MKHTLSLLALCTLTCCAIGCGHEDPTGQDAMDANRQEDPSASNAVIGPVIDDDPVNNADNSTPTGSEDDAMNATPNSSTPTGSDENRATNADAMDMPDEPVEIDDDHPTLRSQFEYLDLEAIRRAHVNTIGKMGTRPDKTRTRVVSRYEAAALVTHALGPVHTSSAVVAGWLAQHISTPGARGLVYNAPSSPDVLHLVWPEDLRPVGLEHGLMIVLEPGTTQVIGATSTGFIPEPGRTWCQAFPGIQVLSNDDLSPCPAPPGQDGLVSFSQNDPRTLAEFFAGDTIPVWDLCEHTLYDEIDDENACVRWPFFKQPDPPSYSYTLDWVRRVQHQAAWALGTSPMDTQSLVVDGAYALERLGWYAPGALDDPEVGAYLKQALLHPRARAILTVQSYNPEYLIVPLFDEFESVERPASLTHIQGLVFPLSHDQACSQYAPTPVEFASLEDSACQHTGIQLLGCQRLTQPCPSGVNALEMSPSPSDTIKLADIDLGHPELDGWSTCMSTFQGDTSCVNVP